MLASLNEDETLHTAQWGTLSGNTTHQGIFDDCPRVVRGCSAICSAQCLYRLAYTDPLYEWCKPVQLLMRLNPYHLVDGG